MSKQYVKNQLLCTFSKPKYLEQNIKDIKTQYNLINEKIIAIQNIENEDELFCIYNIVVEDRNTNYPNTILIHRKRKTNTLYTINSLNSLIWLLNDGKFSHDFIVPWENYRNTLLLIRDNDLLKIETKLYKTFKFD